MKKKIVSDKKSGNHSAKKIAVKALAPATAAPSAASASSVKPANTSAPTTGPVKIVVPPPVVKKHLLYVDVSPDKYFILCDGRKIKSGKELADILQVMNDDMFKYHVTDTKNDFSNWINDVFGEPELAKKLRTVRSRLEMSIELYRGMFDKLDKLTRQK